MSILFSKLTELFPKDTMWVDGCAEIIGYSYKENVHIVIDDGQCRSSNGKYLVHKYIPSNPIKHLAEWNSGKYPLKYLIDEEKVFEDWIDFSD